MVKNVSGGNKHKGYARKFVNVKQNNKLRLSESEGELYAVVTNMLGNGMFYAHCIDDNKCLGLIRGKFSGRGKRDNMVEPGKWVLVGTRPWDSGKDGAAKVRKCDLLEVYSDLDKEKLRDSVQENWGILISNYSTINKGTGDATMDGIEFATERDEEYNKLMGELSKEHAKNIGFKTDEENDGNQNDWINIDDI